MRFSLSTSWNAARYTSGRDLIFEIKELGFDEVELSFNLTASMVSQIEELVKDGSIKISSLHNFCPIPENVKRELALPDFYSMSSTNEEERNKSVEQTKNTIATAARLKAQAVVLHTGRVEMEDDTRKLMELFRSGLAEKEEFKRLRQAFIESRRKQAAPFLENTLRSLEELNSFAVKENIKLGVETRFYFREIPVFEELGIIFEKFKGSNIFYWHDTGHAQLMDDLGLARHKDFLDAYGGLLLGIHLHDILNCQDHLAPSCGEIDFGMIAPYIKEGVLKVIEAHSRSSASEIKKGAEFLEKIFVKNG